MTNTDFEEKVLKKLSGLEDNVSGLGKKLSGLEDNVSGLGKKLSGLEDNISSLHNKFDKLDDRVDDMESNLTQEIRMQGAYLNQAFDRMSFLQQNKQDKHFGEAK